MTPRCAAIADVPTAWWRSSAELKSWASKRGCDFVAARRVIMAAKHRFFQGRIKAHPPNSSRKNQHRMLTGNFSSFFGCCRERNELQKRPKIAPIQKQQLPGFPESKKHQEGTLLQRLPLQCFLSSTPVTPRQMVPEQNTPHFQVRYKDRAEDMQKTHGVQNPTDRAE